MIFEQLLARETHTHEAAPDVVFVTGWDDDSGNMVCIAVVDRLTGTAHVNDLMNRWIDLQSRLGYEDTDEHQWWFSVAFVACDSPYADNDWPIYRDFDPLTSADYAALRAEAGERAT